MEMKPNVELLCYTDEPERTVALAARLCYSAVGIAELSERISDDEVNRLLKRLLEMGHASPFEHASFTFGVEGISRVTSHQLVRHRIASYSQQSQRYVRKTKQFDYVLPPSIRRRKDARERYERLMTELHALYREFLEAGIAAEDARYILPGAAETKIVVTMNARELRHFFRQRCCTRAQWEIRKMAELMLERVSEVAPNLFADCGPPCLVGPCPEGEMSCGRVSSAPSATRKRPRAHVRR
ncbi:MAG: FAD-dependent thymidylate synthase [Candidatus Abyssobacteria bacterium SURF_17]|uniref:Flavin-dependent thymidylate synthase n=1 Tax=Candidatus Abyssobacteria bacterium SURF_17 TaxID=2093361 RepID=A0A419F0F8_9BACT|nr:MAG: FAD-dependent thymidylate synthase [Candidatus Abyssubacteria bacterium SURF_17]